MKNQSNKTSKQESNKSLQNSMQQQCDRNNSSVENKVQATEYGKQYNQNVEAHKQTEE